jgi:hypothetical protein
MGMAGLMGGQTAGAFLMGWLSCAIRKRWILPGASAGSSIGIIV